MSQEREEIIVGDVSKNETKAQRKARVASVLERGMAGDRLQVPLPDDVKGEWVPDDKLEIFRMEGLGYKIDTVHASKRRLHDGGDGVSKVGDVVFMTTSKENYDFIQEVQTEMREANSNPKKQKEDTETVNLLEKQGLPSVNQSKADSVSGAQIRETLLAESK